MTGAARGIGQGIASFLGDLGATVVAVDIDETALEEIYGTSHERISPMVGDLAADDVGSLAEAITSQYGIIDLLVNNVGIDTPHSFLTLTEPDYDRVFSTNLRGPWFFTKALVAPLISAGRPGAIVFVSSLHDTFVRGLPHYSASKAAVAMLVRELAQELAHDGIRVNAVSPGIVRSAHVKPDLGSEEQPPIIPLGRIGQPLDVAKVVAVLLSDGWSGYVTGENIRIDGGLGLFSWSSLV